MPLRAKRQKNIPSFFNDHPLAAPYPRYNAIFEQQAGAHEARARDLTVPERTRRTVASTSTRSDAPVGRTCGAAFPPASSPWGSALLGGVAMTTPGRISRAVQVARVRQGVLEQDKAERRRMARYGFHGRDGYFDELLAAL